MTEYKVAAVERAVTILNAFAEVDGWLSLAELTSRVGLSKPTIFRIAASLERAGYLRRDPAGRYQLGPMVFRLGVAYQKSFRLEEHVVPVLRDLVKRANESATFHVRAGADRICLFRQDSDHSVLDNIKVGDRFPLARGAAGKVLLAFSGEPGAEFEAIRAAGHAATFGERDPDCGGVSAPVFAYGRSLYGTVSVSGPLFRFDPPAIHRLTPLVLEAATRISRAMEGDTGILDRSLAALAGRQTPTRPPRKAARG